jgi:hypothetical protein
MGMDDMALEEKKTQNIDPSIPLLDSNPVDAAEQVLAFYNQRPQTRASLDLKSANTCSIFIALSKIRLLAQANKHEVAINTFFNLQLVPSTSNYLDTASKAATFSDLDELIARVMPSMMLMISNSLYGLFLQINKQSFSDFNQKQQQVQMIKEKSRALVSFAGSIKYLVASDILAKMNKNSVLIQC